MKNHLARKVLLYTTALHLMLIIITIGLLMEFGERPGFTIGNVFIKVAILSPLILLSLNHAVTRMHPGVKAHEDNAPELVEAMNAVLRKYPNPSSLHLRLVHDEAPWVLHHGFRFLRQSTISMSVGAVNLLQPAEREVVLAHELGHYHHRDVESGFYAVIARLLLTWLFLEGLTLNIVALVKTGQNLSGDGWGDLFTSLFALGMAWLLMKIVNTLMNLLREMRADLFATQLLKDPKAQVSSLEKIVEGLRVAKLKTRERSRRYPTVELRIKLLKATNPELMATE